LAKFRYSAIRDSGEMVSGEIEGSDRSMVLGRLGEQGLHPVEVRGAENEVSASRMFKLGGGPASFKEISVFTRELGWLLRAGMTLNQALDILAKEAFSSTFGGIIATMRADIRKGKSFHQALQESKAFPPYYVSMIEVGEASGTLPGVLERISIAREREEKIRGRLVSALIYPALLVTLATGAVIFIMVAVVPSIKDMIEGSGAPIPDQARFVIETSDWLIANGQNVLIGVPLTALVLVALFGGSAMQSLLKSFGMMIPVIGSLMKKGAVVRFCRILGTLLAAGVSVSDSLKLMQPTAETPQIRRTLTDMESALRQGGNFLAPLENSRIFPPLLARMLAVGSETGNLTASVLQVTDILEDELDRQAERALTLIEPAIILALSGVVAFIITSLMSAIISVNDLAM
jgi:general secretion pathway protein F